MTDHEVVMFLRARVGEIRGDLVEATEQPPPWDASHVMRLLRMLHAGAELLRRYEQRVALRNAIEMRRRGSQ